MEKKISKKMHVVETCLDLFIARGLDNTSTRDLANALNLQNAAIYYYFNTKKELVSECCKLAISRLESKMTEIMLAEGKSIEQMLQDMDDHTQELAPTMRFLVSVILSKEYENLAKPYLSKLEERYDKYAETLANIHGVTKEEFKAPVYMSILAFNNYMIFNERSLFEPQIQLVKEAFLKRLNK